MLRDPLITQGCACTPLLEIKVVHTYVPGIHKYLVHTCHCIRTYVSWLAALGLSSLTCPYCVYQVSCVLLLLLAFALAFFLASFGFGFAPYSS